MSVKTKNKENTQCDILSCKNVKFVNIYSQVIGLYYNTLIIREEYIIILKELEKNIL